MMLLLTVLVGSLLLSFSMGADDAALITNLPGLGEKPNFRQYSGYLRASPTHQLHYWFVESQTSPSADPMVVWYNGGPGCSSMEGLLGEHGPFLIQPNMSLARNPHAWNLRANVLYIEAPAGVGFSFSTDGNVKTNDVQTAKENHEALKDFFQKFPEFSRNDLFITGESYGGIYVPSLTVLLLNDPSFSNLKGIAVGNGLSSWVYNTASMFYFAYYHGLVDTPKWNSFRKGCNCSSDPCFFNVSTAACREAQDGLQDALSGYDVYNVYSPCYNPTNQGRTLGSRISHLFPPNTFMKLKSSPDCTNSTAMTDYLNRPEVRSALHIPTAVQTWEICTDLGYQNVFRDMTPIYRAILRTNTRVLIYNGDVDMACNFLGDEWFFEAMKLPVDFSGRKWYLPSSIGRQIGGVSKSFLRGKLLFTTIRGSGHMVPEDKPEVAYHMIDRFLHNLPL